MRETWQVCVGFEHTVQCMLAVSDLVDYTRAGADPGGGGGGVDGVASHPPHLQATPTFMS